MRVASLRLRLLAALVDTAIVLGSIAAVVGLGIAGVVVYGRARGDDRGEEGQQEGDKQDKPGVDGEDEPVDLHRAPSGAAQTSWLHTALAGAGTGLAVAIAIGAARATGCSDCVVSMPTPAGPSGSQRPSGSVL